MQHTAVDHNNGAEFLTTSHAARALQVSEGNVRRLATLGILPCVRVGTLRLFRIADVRTLAEARAAE